MLSACKWRLPPPFLSSTEKQICSKYGWLSSSLWNKQERGPAKPLMNLQSADTYWHRALPAKATAPQLPSFQSLQPCLWLQILSVTDTYRSWEDLSEEEKYWESWHCDECTGGGGSHPAALSLCTLVHHLHLFYVFYSMYHAESVTSSCDKFREISCWLCY